MNVKPAYYNANRAYHGDQATPADPHRQYASSDPYGDVGYGGPPGGGPQYRQDNYPPQGYGGPPPGAGPSGGYGAPPPQQRGYAPPRPERPPQGLDTRAGYGQNYGGPSPDQGSRAPSRAGANSSMGRRPDMTPTSPVRKNFDNAFPVFPSKKDRVSEEKTREDFSRMNMNDSGRPSQDGRPQTASSKMSHESGRSRAPSAAAGGGYGQDRYNSQSRQGQYNDQRPDNGYDNYPPAPAQGYPSDSGYYEQQQNPPPQQPYGRGNVPANSPARAPPSRNNTLPDEGYGRGAHLEANPRGNQIARPSTATGDYRPPAQRGYGAEPQPPRSKSRQAERTYDMSATYYPGQHGLPPPEQYPEETPDFDDGRGRPNDPDMPRALNFSRRQQNGPEYGQPNEWQDQRQDPRGAPQGPPQGPPQGHPQGPPQGYPDDQFRGLAKRSRSQPDLRGQNRVDQQRVPGQDGAPELPRNGYGQVPNQYGNQYDSGYDQRRGPPPAGPLPQGPPGPGPNGYPARQNSGSDGRNPGYGGPPRGYPDNRSPPGPGYGQDGYGPDGRPMTAGGRAPSRGAGRPPAPDALPEHPTPVRPGLMQGGMVSQNPAPRHPQQQPPSSMPVPNNRVSGGIPQEGPLTPAFLEQLRQACRSSPHNMRLQLQLATTLVEASTVLANDGGRADANTTARNRENFIFEAHKILKRLVSAGYPDAIFYMADCYGRGALGLQPDMREAFNLYLSAAKLGHPGAAYRTAVCCELGHEEGGGTRKDPLQAIQWYKKAASAGEVPAMFKLGMIQLKGLLGQPKNPREAVNWLKKAAASADEENPHALYELAQIYENADPNGSVVKDLKYARELYTKAGEFNHKLASFRLGCAYEYGNLECEIDPRQSIYWYSRAAVQGEHQSELALSGWYLTGSEGVIKQSDTEAYLWARKAAIAGLGKAEFAMGYFIESGIGSPANVEEAKKWYAKAAAQSVPKARERLDELNRGAAAKGQRGRKEMHKGKKDDDCVVM